jgi:hypothetical protein
LADYVLTYDPDKAVSEFVRLYGVIGREVLYAYNDADPLGTGVQEDDEYLYEARQFMNAILTSFACGIGTAVYDSLRADMEYIPTPKLEEVEDRIKAAFDANVM